MTNQAASRWRMTARAAVLGIAGLGATVTGVAVAHAGGGHGAHGGKAASHGAGHRGPMGLLPGTVHPRQLERMANELGLSPEQRQTIRAMFEAARPEMQQLREQLHAAGRQLTEVQPGDTAYDATVQEASQRFGDLTARMIQQGSQLRTQVHTVLTREQQAKFAQLQAERRAKREERGQQRRERMEQRQQRIEERRNAPAAG